eukprot:TRINITY_DN3090_c0_g3_i3.p1 TRINITY_DN3090_c0_g3~~TRINITY_DN3090_c0_g3_i3.p1  ORF type:complete len:129 (-),score=17.10 TRINITY_DN3090_c0_g3_i3:107-493(-)
MLQPYCFHRSVLSLPLSLSRFLETVSHGCCINKGKKKEEEKKKTINNPGSETTRKKKKRKKKSTGTKLTQRKRKKKEQRKETEEEECQTRFAFSRPLHSPFIAVLELIAIFKAPLRESRPLSDSMRKQ